MLSRLGFRCRILGLRQCVDRDARTSGYGYLGYQVAAKKRRVVVCILMLPPLSEVAGMNPEVTRRAWDSQTDSLSGSPSGPHPFN